MHEERSFSNFQMLERKSKKARRQEGGLQSVVQLSSIQDFRNVHGMETGPSERPFFKSETSSRRRLEAIPPLISNPFRVPSSGKRKSRKI